MPRRLLSFFTGGDKSKHGNNASDNQNVANESTGKRRMSISRSGRFKEQKHRSKITENTFSQLQNDNKQPKDQPESNGKENTVSGTGDKSFSTDFENEQWESVNKPAVSYMEKKEAALKATASKGKKETSI